MLLGLAASVLVFVAVAKVRRSKKERLVVDKAISVFSPVLRRCKCQMLWNTRIVDGRTAPAPAFLPMAARAIVDSMMVKGAEAVHLLVC